MGDKSSLLAAINEAAVGLNVGGAGAQGNKLMKKSNVTNSMARDL